MGSPTEEMLMFENSGVKIIMFSPREGYSQRATIFYETWIFFNPRELRAPTLSIKYLTRGLGLSMGEGSNS